MFDDVDTDTTQVIHELFGKSQIKLQKVQKQQGSDDCGWFAIAFVVSLVRKTDPSQVCFMQSIANETTLDKIVFKKDGSLVFQLSTNY